MTVSRCIRGVKRLWHDRRGLAMIEFALVAPVVLILGTCGLEMANYAIVRMRLSQITVTVADNISRVGLDNGLSVTQLTENDVNDTFGGVAVTGSTMNALEKGRVIISSLETNSSGGQWIHWQRCKGVKNVPSDWGVEGTGATGTALKGMGPGPDAAKVKSPSTSIAVVYVETFYDYQPLFPFLWSAAPNGGAPGASVLGSVFNNTMRAIKYENSFMVRDSRDLNPDTARNGGKGIFNPDNPLTKTPSPQSLCSIYSAT